MAQLKALGILKDDLEKLEAKKILFPRFSFMDETISLTKEAVAELEELSNPKTCNFCKHQPIFDGEVYAEECGTCQRFFSDHYEPKDTL